MKLRPQSTENKQKTSADDMAKMHDLLVEKESLLAEKDDVIEQKSEVIIEQKARIALLESYLRLANQKRFGASSEQTSPAQGELFNEAEGCTEPEQDERPAEEPTKPKGKKGRKPFNHKLPRHQVFAYLSEAEKAGAIDTFFVKVREELDIIPAQVRVLEYMQEKATFKTEDGGRTLKAAEVVKHPVPKAMGVDLAVNSKSITYVSNPAIYERF